MVLRALRRRPVATFWSVAVALELLLIPLFLLLAPMRRSSAGSTRPVSRSTRISSAPCANVLRHAGHPATVVSVAVRNGKVELAVRNAGGDPPASAAGRRSSSGQGLASIRRRARRLGGSAQAGPVDGGFLSGWTSRSCRDRLVADDDALVRSGLRAILAGEEDLEVVAEAADGEDASRQVVATDPDAS